jgi:hypothetical protein
MLTADSHRVNRAKLTRKTLRLWKPCVPHGIPHGFDAVIVTALSPVTRTVRGIPDGSR